MDGPTSGESRGGYDFKSTACCHKKWLTTGSLGIHFDQKLSGICKDLRGSSSNSKKWYALHSLIYISICTKGKGGCSS